MLIHVLYNKVCIINIKKAIIQTKLFVFEIYCATPVQF